MVKNWLHVIFMTSIILVGGCQVNSEDPQTNKPSEMKTEELPDVRAFEDEFTREFLQSAEETRPGYYPFLSGTGKYEMDFPAGGIIGERGYSKDEKRFESFIIGIEGAEFESSIVLRYMLNKKENEKVSLDMLQKSIGKEISFEKIELKGRNVFFTPQELENGDFGYAAYVQNTEDPGGIYIDYLSSCIVEKTKCSNQKDAERTLIIDWLKTIEFIDESE